jgi:hypothetical protein
LKLTEAVLRAAGDLFGQWVNDQLRLREIVGRPWGRFELPNGMPIVRLADYHHPEHLRPRYLSSPDSN